MKMRRTKAPAGKKQGVAKRKRQSLAGLMPLEPRVMYDAAGAHTAASHMVLDPHHNDPSHLDPSHLADLSNHPQANASTSTDNAPQKTTSTSPVPGSITSITATGFNAAADTYTLEITGAGTAAEYQQVLREVDYGSLSGDDPTAVGSHTQRGVTWFLSTDGTTFPNATGNMSTLDVLHSAKIAAGNTQNYLEGGGPVVIEPFVTFGDTDTITQVQL